MSISVELQNQIIELVEKIKEEEEVLISIKGDEYEKWKYGDRDTYDKQLGQQRVEDKKRYIELLKYELFKLVGNK